ncbi:MAG: RNA-splicing ligase RtcB, partial [Pseudomonadota bacterium]
MATEGDGGRQITGNITGKTLIEWGYAPGKWFAKAVDAANAAAARGADAEALRAVVDAHAPPPPIPLRAKGEAAYGRFIDAETDLERANVAAVDAAMAELMRTPTIRAGAVMPDACPTGGAGSIPVGGAVACENAIHPAFHSADICCSVAISVLGDVDPTQVLDLALERTHFGGGGRGEGRGARARPLLDAPAVLAEFADNPFLNGLEEAAHAHFGTQGDGNHFLFVGRLRSTGEVALVTHHGSRKPG